MTTVSGAAQPTAGLANHLRGRVTRPDSPDWDTARTSWNRRIDQRPLLVVDAAGPDDIAATLAHAAPQPARPGPAHRHVLAAVTLNLTGTEMTARDEISARVGSTWVAHGSARRQQAPTSQRTRASGSLSGSVERCPSGCWPCRRPLHRSRLQQLAWHP